LAKKTKSRIAFHFFGEILPLLFFLAKTALGLLSSVPESVAGRDMFASATIVVICFTVFLQVCIKYGFSHYSFLGGNDKAVVIFAESGKGRRSSIYYD
jgi:hypothetical protein